jgi:hypothetical protein
MITTMTALIFGKDLYPYFTELLFIRAFRVLLCYRVRYVISQS